jgi:hypothetical protein
MAVCWCCGSSGSGRGAPGIPDPRAAERIAHGLDEIIRFCVLMIATGSEDGNDDDSIRTYPLFVLAMDCLPENPHMCSHPRPSAPNAADIEPIPTPNLIRL